MTWTHFMDMHSGGGTKEPYENIYIEAPEAEARVIFFNRFGHNPERVSCTCCGEDYSTSEHPTLEAATAYERNCEWNDAADGWVEKQRQQNMDIRERCSTPANDPWGLYRTLDEYLKVGADRDGPPLVIAADEIKDSERSGDVPTEGYVWV